jgi:hypothetical protein
VVDRGALEFAFDATVMPTDPLPLPDDVPTDAHEAALEVVHVQLAALAVIPIAPEPPAAPYGLPRPEVSTVMLQDRADCTIVSV